MATPTPTALELATLDELVDEIDRRSRALVLIVEFAARENGKTATTTIWRGSSNWALGLLAFGRWDIERSAYDPDRRTESDHG